MGFQHPLQDRGPDHHRSHRSHRSLRSHRSHRFARLLFPLRRPLRGYKWRGGQWLLYTSEARFSIRQAIAPRTPYSGSCATRAGLARQDRTPRLFPVALAEAVLTALADPGDLIYQPFGTDDLGIGVFHAGTFSPSGGSVA